MLSVNEIEVFEDRQMFEEGVRYFDGEARLHQGNMQQDTLYRGMNLTEGNLAAEEGDTNL